MSKDSASLMSEGRTFHKRFKKTFQKDLLVFSENDIRENALNWKTCLEAYILVRGCPFPDWSTNEDFRLIQCCR
jgi:hypothetical protein